MVQVFDWMLDAPERRGSRDCGVSHAIPINRAVAKQPSPTVCPVSIRASFATCVNLRSSPYGTRTLVFGCFSCRYCVGLAMSEIVGGGHC